LAWVTGTTVDGRWRFLLSQEVNMNDENQLKLSDFNSM